jgi:hypothetical protein
VTPAIGVIAARRRGGELALSWQQALSQEHEHIAGERLREDGVQNDEQPVDTA